MQKKKNTSRLLAAVLAFIMMLGMLPATAFAATDVSDTANVNLQYADGTQIPLYAYEGNQNIWWGTADGSGRNAYYAEVAEGTESIQVKLTYHADLDAHDWKITSIGTQANTWTSIQLSAFPFSADEFPDITEGENYFFIKCWDSAGNTGYVDVVLIKVVDDDIDDDDPPDEPPDDPPPVEANVQLRLIDETAVSLERYTGSNTYIGTSADFHPGMDVWFAIVPEGTTTITINPVYDGALDMHNSGGGVEWGPTVFGGAWANVSLSSYRFVPARFPDIANGENYHIILCFDYDIQLYSDIILVRVGDEKEPPDEPLPEPPPMLINLGLSYYDEYNALLQASLSPSFSSDNFTYTTMTFNANLLRVYASPESGTTVTINGIPSAGVTPNLDLTPEKEGITTITIVVTRGEISSTYTIEVVVCNIDINYQMSQEIQKYVSGNNQIFIYDCNWDDVAIYFDASADILFNGVPATVELSVPTNSTSLGYSFNAETGAVTILSDRDYISIRMQMNLKEFPGYSYTVSYYIISSMRKNIERSGGIPVVLELPENGNITAQIIDGGTRYQTWGGGIEWEFPVNDYFVGTSISPYLYQARITPVRPGRQTIYATPNLTGETIPIEVIIAGTRVMRADGGKAEAVLASSDTPEQKLQLTAYGDNPDDTFIWESLDESVATVDQNGLVTPVTEGTVIISATAVSTGKKGAAVVLVRENGRRYLDNLVMTAAGQQFTTGFNFKTNVFEYELTCPEGSTAGYFGSLRITPTFDSVTTDAVLLYTDIDGVTFEFILESGSQLSTGEFLISGENVVTINMVEKETGIVTAYTFLITRPLSLVNTLAGLSIAPTHREAAAYPKYTPEINGTLFTNYSMSECSVYRFIGNTLFETWSAGATIVYTAVFSDVEAISLLPDKSMPREQIIRVKRNDTGVYYTESELGYIPIKESGETEFTIEIMAAKTAELQSEFVVERSHVLIVQKLNLVPVDMSGVYIETAEFSEGVITYTPPADFDPRTHLGVNVLIPNQGDSWVDVTLTPGARLFLESVSEQNEIQISSDKYRIPLTAGTVKAVLLATIDGIECEKVYTFTVTQRGTLRTADAVTDFLNAPSQYTNKDFGSFPEKTLMGTGLSSYASVVSLGNFGGYITYYFEDGIRNDPNNAYGVDFIVYANSYGGPGFSEPGNVLVSEDGETWYSLAGSDFFDDNTIWGYEVTYTKMSDGRAYYQHANGTGIWREYPDWERYPLTNYSGDSFTVRGNLLMGRGSLDEWGSTMAAYPDWGYVDVNTNGTIDGNGPNPYGGVRTGGDVFDLAWAVDKNGVPVDVEGKTFHYVKVETASFVIAGVIGEKSTEVNSLVLADAQSQPVGKTAAPAAITVNGEQIDLQDGVYIYNNVIVPADGAFAVSVMTNEDANIYINSAGGASFTFGKAPNHGIIRIIVQEGEREPVIYYLNLIADGTAAKSSAVTFNAAGGTINGLPSDTLYYTEGTVDKTFPIPVYQSRRFLGWFTEDGTKYDNWTVDMPEELTLTARWEYILPQGETPQRRVSFRLIGSTISNGDVDLTGNDPAGYNGAEYVTWIGTRNYTVNAGDTVYELFVRALADAGLQSAGADKNYVTAIWAPASLGGYKLEEFTNSAYSGWMYTVNGVHVGSGLRDWDLQAGDVVVFHYVNDFRYEISDWFDDGEYPELGDGSLHNQWLTAPDITGGSTGTIGVNRPSIISENESAIDDSETDIDDNETPLASRVWLNQFVDVSGGAWYFEAVRYAFVNNLMNGVSDTGFAPASNLTRAMLVTILARSTGMNTDGGETWYSRAAAWGVDKRITDGTNMTGDVTREQFVTMLFRYANEILGIDTSKRADISQYDDAGDVSDWASEAMSWAVAEELVKGRTSTSLAPIGTATRAEAAMLLMRFLEMTKSVPSPV